MSSNLRKTDANRALTRNDERVLKALKSGEFSPHLARDYQALDRLIAHGLVERTPSGIFRAKSQMEIEHEKSA